MKFQPVQIVSTYPTGEDAARTGEEAVKLHMAACAQVSSEITSIYRWEGEVTSSREFQLTLKTLNTMETRLISWLREHHPYQVAEILVVPLSCVSPEYLSWMKEVVN
jgi:periplasmic divalent cation tolerance protein